MNLYTVIHEYRGGTYVYQVEAIDENEALLKWGREIDPQLVQFNRHLSRVLKIVGVPALFYLVL